MNGNHVAMGLAEMLFAIIIMVINQKFFINGFKGIIHKSPNMDTLVALGSGASFAYSTYALFAMTVAQAAGDMQKAMSYMDEFYFESAAMILTLITVGKMLEAHSKGKTTDALKGLMSLTPKTANVIVDGIEKILPVEQVKKGDIFVVRPGESIPVDAVIIDGSTAVDESALTGESIPVDKVQGDTVSAATSVGLYQMRGFKSRGGYNTFADNQNGQRCRRYKGADCKNRRQGFRRVCPCRNLYSRCYIHSMDCCRQIIRIFACKGDFGARNQLSVCARFGNSGGRYGRKRQGRKKRHFV